MSEVNGHKNDFPKGWHKVKLGDIISVSSGKGIKINGLLGGSYPVYGGNGITGYHSEYFLDDPKLIIGRVGVKCGVTHITKPKSWVSDNALIVEPKIKDFNIKFFQLKLGYEDLNKLSVSTAQPVISGSKIYAYEIVYPEIEIQNQIVSKIEELFSELDKSIEQLKTAQQQLKVYRQSVLKWAFEGKLTVEWRKKSNQPVDFLLNKIRLQRSKFFAEKKKKLKLSTGFSEDERKELFALPENWEWIRIVETVLNTADDIVDGPFGSNLKNSDFDPLGDVPVIGITNIDEGFKKGIRYITKEKFETIKRSAVYPGDIIVAKIGSSYGKVGVYPDTMPIGVIPANLLRIRPSTFFKKKLLLYYLKSRVFKKKLDRIMKSTAQPAYNVSQFKDIPIPIMSIEEQKQIVQEIESRLSIADKLEETITNSLQQAEALRQSILKNAFEGTLINQ